MAVALVSSLAAVGAVAASPDSGADSPVPTDPATNATDGAQGQTIVVEAGDERVAAVVPPQHDADNIRQAVRSDVRAAERPGAASESAASVSMSDLNVSTNTEVVSERVDDKSTYGADSRVSAMATTKTDRATDTVNGGTISLDTSQTGNFYTTLTTANYEGSGSAEAEWLGSEPYNADRMRLTNKVQVNGVEVSLTISYPPGMNIRSGSNTAVYDSGFVEDAWRIEHSYSGLEASTHFALYGATQDDTATFEFRSGSQDGQLESYSITTHTRVDAGML